MIPARKLQLFAAAAAFNALIALSLLTAQPARATTCPPYSACLPTPLCPNSANFCQSIAPAGCTVQTSGCILTQQCNTETQRLLYCQYVSS